MATVVVVLNDTGDGDVDVQVTFAPPVCPGEPASPAQRLGAALLAHFEAEYQATRTAERTT